ncbi:hypothetical protein GUITHDRAFT_114494 [Guillardia theta CCMP2712]|uniref:WW domain-containing protein n=1 Tax=Guillardia theta (strain CCMP2712) TaxID=905079 RepID=L1ITT7_GUITC|nr:hypothetical protein GUITHDRAFT_114494 [Guillardia theta CCMP2712]EKX39527.1 hypothetical protein GUITHDRAFT_114494 [Guillardia theta CCMP2712]|eukprot:XP_005826507.1 hypothetical protein GUITHDRAFT_114494 [Guillardia theta CCMP2712]
MSKDVTNIEDPWTAVSDPKTGGTYYWNRLTNETTMVGEAKPLGMYRNGPPQQSQESFGGMLINSLAIGAGITVAFSFVRFFF